MDEVQTMDLSAFKAIIHGFSFGQGEGFVKARSFGSVDETSVFFLVKVSG